MEEDWDVRVLLRNSSDRSKLPEGLAAQIFLGDLTSETGLAEACENVECILHLAGQAHVGSAPARADKNLDVAAAKNLLAAALSERVRRIVYLSSSLAQAAETGRGDMTAYGVGKLRVEQLFTAAAAQGSIDVIVLRSVNVYGIGMKGNIANMISMINRGRLPPLPPLTSRISLVGSDDLAAALLLAVKSEQAAARIYTVTDGEKYAVTEIESAIYAALGKRMPMWRTPAVILYAASAVAGLLARLGWRDSSISSRTYRNLSTDNLFDNSAVCEDFGFAPRSDLYSTLPEIVDDLVKTTNRNQ